VGAVGDRIDREIPTVKIGGLRVTDDETMNLVAMALCGAASTVMARSLDSRMAPRR